MGVCLDLYISPSAVNRSFQIPSIYSLDSLTSGKMFHDLKLSARAKLGNEEKQRHKTRHYG